MNTEVSVSAIWLRTYDDGRVEVLAEIAGEWRLCIQDRGTRIGHIIEARGIEKAPADYLTDYSAERVHP